MLRLLAVTQRILLSHIFVGLLGLIVIVATEDQCVNISGMLFLRLPIIVLNFAVRKNVDDTLKCIQICMRYIKKFLDEIIIQLVFRCV